MTDKFEVEEMFFGDQEMGVNLGKLRRKDKFSFDKEALDLGEFIDESKNPQMIDLDWLSDTEGNFDPNSMKNPINIKGILVEEWIGDLPIEFDEQVIISSKKPEKKNRILVAAMNGLNRGLMGKELSSYIRSNVIDAVEFASISDSLRARMKKAYGVLGNIVVDARLVGGCKKLAKFLSKHPHKDTIKYVIGCDCAEHQLQVVDRRNRDAEVEEYTGSIDHLLREEKPQETSEVSIPICTKSGLVAVSNYKVLENQVDIQSVRKASLKRYSKDVEGRIQSSEDAPIEDHTIEKSALVAESKPVQEDIPVDGDAYYYSQDVEIARQRELDASADSDNQPRISDNPDFDVEYSSVGMGELDVDPSAEEQSEIELASVSETIKIDEKAVTHKGFDSEEVEVELDKNSELEIDPQGSSMEV